MKKTPDHKFRTVQKAVAENKPVEDSLAELRAVLTSPDGGVMALRRALDIYQSEYKRDVIESFLIANASPKEIDDVLQVPADVTKYYLLYFFDLSAFEDKLDRIHYANAYPRSEYGKDLMRYAIDLGKECLKIRMSCGAYSVAPKFVRNEILATAYLMSQVVRINPLNSNIAKESLKWAQVAFRASDEEEIATDAVKDRIAIALETRNETTNAEDSKITVEDILH